MQRIHRLSRTVHTLGRPILQLARREGLDRLSVLDLACGGGDVAVGLWRWARRRRLELEITGVDISPTAVQRSRRLARRLLAPVQFRRLDVLADPWGEPGRGGFDVVVSSLFVHHLDPPQAVALLRKMTDAARRSVLVHDLRRATGGWLLAQTACRLLSRSPIIHVDGPRSVEGAFTLEEMAELCRAAELTSAVVRRCWPYRLLLSCELRGGRQVGRS